MLENQGFMMGRHWYRPSCKNFARSHFLTCICGPVWLASHSEREEEGKKHSALQRIFEQCSFFEFSESSLSASSPKMAARIERTSVAMLVLCSALRCESSAG
jgi:hypothetical protein